MAKGRPRSEEARQAVYQAVLELVNESGYSALTIEAISSRSGVGRPTIYRWWANKGELLTEAYVERTDANPDLEVPDQGSLEKDLLYFFPRLVTYLSGPSGKVVLAILLESQLVADFEAGFRNLMGRRWKMLEGLFVRALRRGELDEIPAIPIYEAAYGALYFRQLSRHAPLDWAFGEDIARLVLRMLKKDY